MFRWSLHNGDSVSDKFFGILHFLENIALLGKSCPHKVNTFLGNATFSKFLNAFDMKYNKRNEKDIYDCTNEGIFIACMGLSKRADYITRDNIDYYLQGIDNVVLDSELICDMVERMLERPYEGNYLK